MCSQMAFRKGVLGTLSRGTKLDFSGKLPEEMFAVPLHVYIEILLIILVCTLAWGKREYPCSVCQVLYHLNVLS